VLQLLNGKEKIKHMKTKLFLASALTGITTLSAQAGIGIGISIGVPAPPPVVVTAPAVTVAVVPDSYVWDGTEYVGVVNGQYFYLGAGNVWVACDPARLARFHGWEKDHADWRTHAIRNDHYRKDAQGHDHPWGHDKPEPVKSDHDR
jgi:hypothetical protein